MRQIIVFAVLTASVTSTVDAQQPAIRDSAGIRIVTNASRGTAPVAFRLGPTPILNVGGAEADPDQEFDHRQGYLRAVRLSDGRLVVIDVARVHFFTPDGRRQKIVGRRGSGPQEFQYLTAICRTRGDTIVVGDSHNRRLAVLDQDGQILRTIPQGDVGSPPFDFCFDDGTFLLSRSVGEMTAGARPTRLTRVRLDGTVAGVIGEFPGTGFDFVTQSEVTLVPVGQRLYYANPASHQVQIIRPDGTTQLIVRNDDPRVRITDAKVEEQLLSTIPNNVVGADRTSRLAQLRARPHATTWPAFRRVHVDPAGRLWVQTYQTKRAAGDTWTAYDADGRMLGRLELIPPGQGRARLEVIGFGRNDVLVRRSDADGASFLTVYPIQAVAGNR